MTTGRERSTDLVTMSGGLLMAPETKWEPGEMETGGIPPFRGFARLFGHFSPCLFAKRFCQVLSILETSFRTLCDAISIDREKSEKTGESGNLLMAIIYVFVKYLVKPLHCDYAVYVIVSTGYYVHYSVYVLYARFNKQLVLGYVVAQLVVRERMVVPSWTW